MEHWKKLADKKVLSESELKQIPSDCVTNFQTVIDIYLKEFWNVDLLLEGSGLTLTDFSDSAKWIDARTSERISRNFFKYAKKPLNHKYGYAIGSELANTSTIVNTFIKYTPYRTILKNTYNIARKLENAHDFETVSANPKQYAFKVTPKSFKKYTMVGHESFVVEGYLNAICKIKNIKTRNNKILCRSTSLPGLLEFFYKDHGFEINDDEIYLNGELFAEKKSPLKIETLKALNDWGKDDKVFVVKKNYTYRDEPLFSEGEVFNSPFCYYTWELECGSVFLQRFRDLLSHIKIKSLGELDKQIKENNEKAKELLQLSAVLEEERRNKALFLANIVHEIKSPLASIVMLIDSLMDHIECAPDFVKEGFKLLGNKGSKLTNFVDNVMSYFSIDNDSFKLSLENVDLAFLMNDVLDSFLNIPDRKELYINSLITPDKYIIKGDYYRLVQVFLNIIGNSVKFTTSGFIRISAGFEEDYVVVSIEDSGSGIDKDKLDMVFNMFEKNHSSPEENRNGLGLGLYIANSIVKLHNGKIEVKSKKGQGSTFMVSLPYAAV